MASINQTLTNLYGVSNRRPAPIQRGEGNGSRAEWGEIHTNRGLLLEEAKARRTDEWGSRAAEAAPPPPRGRRALPSPILPRSGGEPAPERMLPPPSPIARSRKGRVRSGRRGPRPTICGPTSLLMGLGSRRSGPLYRPVERPQPVAFGKSPHLRVRARFCFVLKFLLVHFQVSRGNHHVFDTLSSFFFLADHMSSFRDLRTCTIPTEIGKYIYENIINFSAGRGVCTYCVVFVFFCVSVDAKT